MAQVRNLKDVREKLLGLRFETVVRLSDLEADRLRAIEEELASPTVFEVDARPRRRS